jgi:hypothetical protein
MGTSVSTSSSLPIVHKTALLAQSFAFIQAGLGDAVMACTV